MGHIIGVPVRINISCLVNDTCLCEIDLKMKNNQHGTKNIIMLNARSLHYIMELS